MFNFQAVIRRSLSESGCPNHILDQLMDNAHERRWPPGLSSLETRQVNNWTFISPIGFNKVISTRVKLLVLVMVALVPGEDIFLLNIFLFLLLPKSIDNFY